MIEVSVLIIAIAFAVLVVFLIKTLKTVQVSLDNVSKTLQEVRGTIDELGYEVKQTVRHANDITADVEHKMKQIDPVVTSVKNLGEILTEVTAAAKQVSTTLMNKFQKKKEGSVDTSVSRAGDSSYTKSLPAPGMTTPTLAHHDNNSSPKWMNYVDIAADTWSRFRK
ncbi:hypothetical protein BK126_25910 [Paenibacillus sp. FSL H7-0326]|uniref:DUF948 domain-containing protein n=1 Tax=Paenibacillus sp. FSL H7-0326 TaxID=1921144 RepID=UPI00096D805E|nr:DUF948 domain-containing protein [Paenibacillus sp. FSL H7-0326]OMC64073.1 hypothetical protein BK126_25910 [Paenibacillus sp. FSL H7-0326]